jgi:hypothetical protein
MKLSEESYLGEFLQELVYIDRRWIRLESCSNNAFLPHGAKEEVDCPIGTFPLLETEVSRVKIAYLLAPVSINFPREDRVPSFR